jgi:hypothetical protein
MRVDGNAEDAEDAEVKMDFLCVLRPLCGGIRMLHGVSKRL